MLYATFGPEGLDMADEKRQYTYEAIPVASTNSGPNERTDTVIKRMNSLGAGGYRYVGTFKFSTPGAPEEYLLMEKETETFMRRSG
jgi:hypothetical protein